MSSRPGLLLSLALSFALPACHRAPRTPEAFAVAFVDAARSGKLGPEWVDAQLVERIRRIQRIELAARGRAPAEVLAKIWAAQLGPPGPPEERARTERAHAARVLTAMLKGDCQGKPDPAGALSRVGAFTSPLDRGPPEAQAEVKKLGDDLRGAAMVRLECAEGAVGLLMVPRGASYRVVDLFAIHSSKPPIQLPPAQ